VSDVVDTNGKLTQFFGGVGTTLVGFGVSTASVAFNPFGGLLVTEAVLQDGSLFTIASNGFIAQEPFSGVQSASVAFDAFGNRVLEVLFQDGTLVPFGPGPQSQSPVTAGVRSANVTSTPFGFVTQVAFLDGSLVIYTPGGPFTLVPAGLGVNADSASLAFSPFGPAVLDVLFQGGVLNQFALPPIGTLIPFGTSSASVTFNPSGQQVLDVVFQGVALQLTVNPFFGFTSVLPLAVV
jgi:hypothetical protein